MRGLKYGLNDSPKVTWLTGRIWAGIGVQTTWSQNLHAYSSAALLSKFLLSSSFILLPSLRQDVSSSPVIWQLPCHAWYYSLMFVSFTQLLQNIYILTAAWWFFLVNHAWVGQWDVRYKSTEVGLEVAWASLGHTVTLWQSQQTVTSWCMLLRFPAGNFLSS